MAVWACSMRVRVRYRTSCSRWQWRCATHRRDSASTRTWPPADSIPRSRICTAGPVTLIHSSYNDSSTYSSPLRMWPADPSALLTSGPITYSQRPPPTVPEVASAATAAKVWSTPSTPSSGTQHTSITFQAYSLHTWHHQSSRCRAATLPIAYATTCSPTRYYGNYGYPCGTPQRPPRVGAGKGTTPGATTPSAVSLIGNQGRTTRSSRVLPQHYNGHSPQPATSSLTAR
mmetsp:Transcript_18973/g.34191  ORF Transcript_18973/g.34191 Transcript_18973/m.34191 type:complete len:230 (+) Transcript_18973:7119-7808(+)